MAKRKVDMVILGAGLYGLYAANYCSKKYSDKEIVVIEKDDGAFKRATTINQARVHMGYHYPRSFTTAKKSIHYFKRFLDEFDFCLKKDFKQIYAISRELSWTNAGQFEKFCKDAEIFCEKVDENKFFKPEMVEAAYLTEEYTYDVGLLRDYFLNEISGRNKAEIQYGLYPTKIAKKNDMFFINLSSGNCLITPFILNATYAGTNMISGMSGFEGFKIKYELCEIILCNVSDELKDVGLTVMDGPFFSIMPFGKTGNHSLTSVTFTPHMTSCEDFPSFDCRINDIEKTEVCDEEVLGNCNSCSRRPQTAWPYMSGLARKYMLEKYGFKYLKSMYSVKPILLSTEVDDARPTMIRVFSKNPTFISVLSGKINTVYDLEEVLDIEGHGSKAKRE